VLEAPRRATTRDRELAEALSSYLIAFRERGEALRLQGIGRFASSHPLYLSAKKQAIKALAMRTRQLGRDAVEVAPLHQLLGLIEDEIGEYRSGVHHFSRALAILESAYGREHAGTITTRSDLGHLLLAAGDYDRAEAIFREVLAHRERSGDQVRGKNALVALGDTLSRAGRLDAAEPMLRRAVSIWESTVGGDHPSAVSAMSYLGAVLVRRGSTAEGEAICSRLDARLQGVAGQSHHRALIDRCLSEAALGRRDFAAASARAESMVRILEAAYGPDGPQVAEGLAFQGAVLTDAGDVASGRGTLERALRIQRRRLGDQHPSTASTIRALARTRAAGAGPRR
jgi:tetratricopeptide (TPR) repeat protein